MLFYRSLNEVFRSWTHVAVLRVLQHTTAGFTGNQVAREAGMHPRSALKALTALEGLGIIHRQRGGRDHLFTLNRDHFLLVEGILPLLQSERRMIEHLETELRRLLKGRVIAAILFGSVARQEEGPRSDVDICLVTGDKSSRVIVQDMLHEHAPRFFRTIGAKLSPIFFTESEFRRKRETSLVKTIVSDGICIVGKIPGVLPRG